MSEEKGEGKSVRRFLLHTMDRFLFYSLNHSMVNHLMVEALA